MKRFCGFPPTPEFKGDLEEMSLLAGASVGHTNRLMSAASIIDEMINDAEAVTRTRLGSMVVDESFPRLPRTATCFDFGHS
jgi:hypothetical protein